MAATPRLVHVPVDDDDMEEGEMVSNLEATIDKLGMGKYQKVLLVLCGFGWLADNMWLEAIAIILPRVQDHFAVSDQSIGWLSTSIFAGMMIGAVGWGTCSDLLGRTWAFNGTLLLTAAFGFCASYLSFGIKSLCVSLFFLGTAIGGSMPTDGTLFMENIPRHKQYLLTALSVFFSFGAVFSAIIALVLIPTNSCPDPPASCDVATQNLGWTYLLSTLSLITIGMFIGRVILFTLVESPRYLVHTGRPGDALVALQHIATYNGSHIRLSIEDVDDTVYNQAVFDTEEASYFPVRTHEPLKDQEVVGDGLDKASIGSAAMDYSSTSDDAQPLGPRYSFRTPTVETRPPPTLSAITPDVRAAMMLSLPPSPGDARRSPSRHRRRTSSFYSVASLPSGRLARIAAYFTGPLEGWTEKMSELLTDEFRTSTILVWLIWGLMSLAYTMFNVYLPKLLEKRLGVVESGGKQRVLWDVVIFTLGGCPGALLGAWMIDTPLGRRKSLAASSAATAVACLGFCLVHSQALVTFITVIISLAATTMWAILYGMTPNIFPPHIRGTACGTASAISRVGGMIAPLLGGHLLAANASLPMYVAAVMFLVAAILPLLLPSDGEQDSSQSFQLSH